MSNDCTYYALTMDEYSGEGSSLSCYNTADYAPIAKCLGLISTCGDYVNADDVGFKHLAELKESHPDTVITNERQFSKRPGKSKGEKRFYVLCLDSNDRFENGGLNAEADGEDVMYCVLELCENWGEVLDWGYSSVEHLLSAWSTEDFQNVGEGKQWSMKDKQ